MPETGVTVKPCCPSRRCRYQWELQTSAESFCPIEWPNFHSDMDEELQIRIRVSAISVLTVSIISHCTWLCISVFDLVSVSCFHSVVSLYLTWYQCIWFGICVGVKAVMSFGSTNSTAGMVFVLTCRLVGLASWKHLRRGGWALSVLNDSVQSSADFRCFISICLFSTSGREYQKELGTGWVQRSTEA